MSPLVVCRYEIMRSCWEFDSENRPTAQELVKLLSDQLLLKEDSLSSSSDDVYIDTFL